MPTDINDIKKAAEKAIKQEAKQSSLNPTESAKKPSLEAENPLGDIGDIFKAGGSREKDGSPSLTGLQRAATLFSGAANTFTEGVKSGIKLFDPKESGNFLPNAAEGLSNIGGAGGSTLAKTFGWDKNPNFKRISDSMGAISKSFGPMISQAQGMSDALTTQQKQILEATAASGQFTGVLQKTAGIYPALNLGMVKVAQETGQDFDTISQAVSGYMKHSSLMASGNLENSSSVERMQASFNSYSQSVQVARQTGIDLNNLLTLQKEAYDDLGITVDQFNKNLLQSSGAIEGTGIPTEKAIGDIKRLGESFSYLNFDMQKSTKEYGAFVQFAKDRKDIFKSPQQAAELFKTTMTGVAGTQQDIAKSSFFGTMASQKGIGGVTGEGIRAGLQFEDLEGVDALKAITQTTKDLFGGEIVSREDAKKDDQSASKYIAQRRFLQQNLGIQDQAKVTRLMQSMETGNVAEFEAARKKAFEGADSEDRKVDSSGFREAQKAYEDSLYTAKQMVDSKLAPMHMALSESAQALSQVIGNKVVKAMGELTQSSMEVSNRFRIMMGKTPSIDKESVEAYYGEQKKVAKKELEKGKSPSTLLPSSKESDNKKGSVNPPSTTSPSSTSPQTKSIPQVPVTPSTSTPAGKSVTPSVSASTKKVNPTPEEVVKKTDTVILKSVGGKEVNQVLSSTTSEIINGVEKVTNNTASQISSEVEKTNKEINKENTQNNNIISESNENNTTNNQQISESKETLKLNKESKYYVDTRSSIEKKLKVIQAQKNFTATRSAYKGKEGSISGAQYNATIDIMNDKSVGEPTTKGGLPVSEKPDSRAENPFNYVTGRRNQISEKSPQREDSLLKQRSDFTTMEPAFKSVDYSDKPASETNLNIPKVDFLPKISKFGISKPESPKLESRFSTPQLPSILDFGKKENINEKQEKLNSGLYAAEQAQYGRKNEMASETKRAQNTASGVRQEQEKKNERANVSQNSSSNQAQDVGPINILLDVQIDGTKVVSSIIKVPQLEEFIKDKIVRQKNQSFIDNGNHSRKA